ncbi:hypothetical protein H4R35_006665 [Dimargaris xerosporica]|nr:hypothetical protein H4R35_006665 [Dimargaris xerosporica]
MVSHAASSSDSDNDSDFVPNYAESPAGLDAIPPPKKRSTQSAPKTLDLEEQASAKRQRIEQLWQSIKQSSDTPHTPSPAATPAPQPSTLVAAKELRSATKAQASNLTSPRAPTMRPLARPIRRASKMSQLVSTLTASKPSRSNTLEQSRSKWDTFVRSENLTEDLVHHNKDGYLERQAFLARTAARVDAEYLRSRKGR